jgi:asparagine synthase (glutamine-hydrolysing)
VSQSDVVGQYSQDIADEVIGLSPLAKAQYIESSLLLSGYLLSSQGDRVSMGNSVEGRYPFLDYRVVEFCAKLPDKFKLNGLNEKYLLKKIMDGKLPQSVVARPKQPYRAPIATALLNGNNTLVDDYLSHSVNDELSIFDSNMVNNLLNRMSKSPQVSEIDAMALMLILSTQIIHRLFILNWQYLPKSSIRKGVVRYTYNPQ